MLALKFRKHPAGLSSLFFAFATLVIHMCGVSLPVFSIKLATETVVLGSFVRLVLTSTLMRPLRIWTWVFSMAILWRSRRKYVLTTASGAYTRIRLAKIASSFFLLRCAVSLFYSTGIITYVFCNFACPVNILTIITFFPSTSTSLSARLRSMRGALTKTLLPWPPISALIKTRRSSRLHGWLTVVGSCTVRVV